MTPTPSSGTRAPRPLLSERDVERLWIRACPDDSGESAPDPVKLARLVEAAVLRKAGRMSSGIVCVYCSADLRELATTAARAAKHLPQSKEK